LLALRYIEREDKQCHRSYVTEGVKDEPHNFYYPGRCPKPVRLEETCKSRLASEYFLTDANRSLLQSKS
jgi:hypothetical protein